MVKTVQIRRCQGSSKLERCSGYAQSHANVFFVNCLSKTIILFRNEIWLSEKQKLFITVFHLFIE